MALAASILYNKIFLKGFWAEWELVTQICPVGDLGSMQGVLLQGASWSEHTTGNAPTEETSIEETNWGFCVGNMENLLWTLGIRANAIY